MAGPTSAAGVAASGATAGAGSKTLHVSVVTPEGSALEREAKAVVFPAYDGEKGVLPGHAPYLTELGIGALRVTELDGSVERMYLEGGFAQVADGKVTILTEKAIDIEDLSPEEAEAATHRWRNGTVSEEAIEARDRALERVRVQRRLAGG